MPFPPRLRRLLRLAPCLLLAACIDNQTDTTQSGGELQLFAADNDVGTFRLRLASSPDATQPNGVDRAEYVNTSSRSFSRLGVAIAENVTFVVGTCVPQRPVFKDTVFTNVLPGDVRIVATGLLPRSLQVFLTEAVSGGIQLVPSVGGRWSGTITTWRNDTATAYAARGYSDGKGAFSFTGIVGSDTLTLNGVLETPTPLRINGYPNRCEGTWQVEPLGTTVTASASTLTVRGPVLPQLNATEPSPDSLRIEFTRLP
jgi:hypothetical protein